MEGDIDITLKKKYFQQILFYALMFYFVLNLGILKDLGARSFCSHLGGVCFVSLFLISFAIVPEVPISLVVHKYIYLATLGNVVRVYPRIVQGLTFLSA